MSVHAALVQVVSDCWTAIGLFWLGAAAFFAVRLDAPAAERARHFLQTLFPERSLLIAVVALAAVSVVVPRAAWRELVFWRVWLAAPGVALIVASAALLVWSRLVLGMMWAARPLIQQQHELRTTGPYALVRHPIYAGFAGMVTGTVLVAGFGRTALWLPVTVAFVTWRVWAEDRMLLRTFGDRYRAYRRRVPALLPLPRP
ncbi:MAG: isoprenylcysteine carboxylmethyltransferase family protein [bacterium]|jgi:protein-S-isoprenylcysteine O-methyltransferase Ste14|nr:isoprenylcysteine carboxylmethyltransferase family protein [bacterium]